MLNECKAKLHSNGSMVQTIPKLIPYTSAEAACPRRRSKLGIPSGHRVCRFPDCSENTCRNGWCEETMKNFKCHCSAGYRGKRCDKPSTTQQDTPTMSTTESTTCRPTTNTPCLPKPCHNGGTCTEIRTGFHCACLDGFHGDRCEYVEDNIITTELTTDSVYTPSAEASKTTKVRETSITAELTMPTAEQTTSLKTSTSTQNDVNSITTDSTTEAATTETLQTTTMATVRETTSTADVSSNRDTNVPESTTAAVTTLDEVISTSTDSTTEAATTETLQTITMTTVRETTSTADVSSDRDATVLESTAATVTTLGPTLGGTTSCSSRCGDSYDPANPCQCNIQCSYYKNCCSDYTLLCVN
ncbi:neurogenic locus notch homolog protein 1-like isoform X2 [Strongylocentrotus purpuratus]|uniref:Uncharacterized protein n=1 Tax=Strongylocentrotus purpuratus TaxID=7668 RepID=A0A7M7NQB9_STRPU|nr:neurogenic locus notch homolog protein 1-like isoform X2 [Strongylocentrotus purpuratus]